MTCLKAVAGALAIMMASGMIADFEVSERDDHIYVRVWAAETQPEAILRKHVAAHLPAVIGETRVIVVSG